LEVALLPFASEAWLARDAEKDEPGPTDLFNVGVVGIVARMMKVPDGSLRILVQATQRVQLGSYLSEQPYLVARVTEMADVSEPSAELEALSRNVQQTFSEIVEQIPYLPEELRLAVANIDDPATLGHLIAGSLRIGTEEKQALLEEVDVAARLRHLSRILARELEVVQLGTQIQTQVQSEVDKGQREFFLRQQLKAIQDELGEGDEQQLEVNELRERIEAAELPEGARKAADRELSRLEKLPPAAAEHGVIRTYLEWLVELPWAQQTEDNLDLKHARRVLDADHYDLEKVKDRILEYLAVKKLRQERGDGAARPASDATAIPVVTAAASNAASMGTRSFRNIVISRVVCGPPVRDHRRACPTRNPARMADMTRTVTRSSPLGRSVSRSDLAAMVTRDPASGGEGGLRHRRLARAGLQRAPPASSAQGRMDACAVRARRKAE